MSQPHNRNCKVEALRPIDKQRGEFWVTNPWEFSNSGENLSAHERNGVYLNSGGTRFLDLSFLSRADSDGDGRTVVGWDITGDGMPELLVRQAGGGALKIYRNRFPKANWLQVSLRGTRSNRFGIGAKLVSEAGGRRICRELYPLVNFLGQKPAIVHFGLKDAGKIDKLTITWPSGAIRVLTNLDVNLHIQISENPETPVRKVR